MPDRCHVCIEPILPGQDAKECPVCGRIGHEDCGGWGHTSDAAEVWVCNACFDEALDREEAPENWEEAERHAL